LAEGRKTKTPQAFWRPAVICLVKILSQPQVRAYRPKPIKEILAAGRVVHLHAAAVHEAKVTGPDPLSSAEVAWQRVGLIKIGAAGKCPRERRISLE
jgi:hypothetical protein